MKREGGFGWSELIAGILLILLGVFTFGKAREHALRLGGSLWHHRHCPGY